MWLESLSNWALSNKAALLIDQENFKSLAVQDQPLEILQEHTDLLIRNPNRSFT